MFHVKHLALILLMVPLFACSQSSTAVIAVKAFPPLPSTDATIENYINSFPESRSLSKGVYEWYYWTNYSRLYPQRFWDSIVNPLLKAFPQFNNSYASGLKKDLLKNSSLPPIKPNRTLIELAKAHAADLAKNSPQNISHTSTNGTTFPQRSSKAGIQRCAAENLITGQTNTAFSLFLLYLDQGLPDVGHRKNLLSPNYVEMGIGIANTDGNNVIVVQDFACDQTK